MSKYYNEQNLLAEDKLVRFWHSSIIPNDCLKKNLEIGIKMIKTVFLSIHPTDPQLRLLNQAVCIIREGGVIVYPTDSGYALGCQLEEREAVERIRNIRSLSKEHLFTLICHDLSQLSRYAHVDNINFRIIKSYIPGPYTFILNASKEVPKRLLHPKRKTIGLRIPNNKILLNLLKLFHSPLMSVSLILEDDDIHFDEKNGFQKLKGQVDLIIEGGSLKNEPTTILDLTGKTPQLIRLGQGKIDL